MTPSEILRAGRARIEASMLSRGDTGRALNGDYEHADYMKALFFLRAACGAGPGDSLHEWDKTATRETTLAAYDRAIEFALSQETANV